MIRRPVGENDLLEADPEAFLDDAGELYPGRRVVAVAQEPDVRHRLHARREASGARHVQASGGRGRLQPGLDEGDQVRPLLRLQATAEEHATLRPPQAEAAPGRVWVEIDGEPLGTLPASIEVLPSAVSVLGSPG